jgi:hypothetical protein
MCTVGHCSFLSVKVTCMDLVALILVYGALVAVTLVRTDVSLILSTLKMEAARSSETTALTRPTWHHVSEDGILHE